MANINKITKGNKLPYHMYTTPYETKTQRNDALIALQREYEHELRQNANASLVGTEISFPDPQLKTRKVDRKGGIDWYIYGERILNSLLYPFTTKATTEFPEQNIMIMEDNAPAHVYHYHDIPRERLGFAKMIWPANSADLNSIETIWTELKDQLHEQIGPRMTARQIRITLEQVIFFPTNNLYSIW